MPRPRGSKTAPETVVYHRACYRFDMAVPAEQKALEMLKNPATKPSGIDAARGTVLFVALREVLSPLTFQKLTSLASDFFTSDAEDKIDHPFVAFAQNIGMQVSIPFVGVNPAAYTIQVDDNEMAETPSRRKEKKKSPAAIKVPAEDKEKPITPNMGDGFDEMDSAELSAIYRMSQAFME